MNERRRMEAKKLTDNCYLVSDSYGNRLGLAMLRGDKVLFTYDVELYDSIEDIANKFNEKLLYTELSSLDTAVKEIDGYPIKHHTIFDLKSETINDTETQTYKVREESVVRFCIGWWIISSDSVYRATLSPKTGTVNERCIGPFKNRFDCQAEVTRMNKERKNG